MGRGLIKRTVMGGTAILLAVLVPAGQVLGATGEKAALPRTGTAESVVTGSLENKETGAAVSGNRVKRESDLSGAGETRESKSERKTESTSGAEHNRSGGSTVPEERGSSGDSATEPGSSRLEEGDGQTKEETGSGQGTGSDQESENGQGTGSDQESESGQETGSGRESESGQESSGGQGAGSSQESSGGQGSGNSQESSGGQESGSGQESSADQESQSSQESRESEEATQSSAAKADAVQGAKVFFEGEGTEEAPYLIGTAKELEKLAELMVSDYESYGNRSYRLTQSIQMKKGRNNHKAIGNQEQPFVGAFDGDGYVISGVRITRPKLTAQGLFGVVGEEGTVRNVGLTENSICGGENVGAIAGINYGTVESCFQTGEVYGLNNNVGSIAGRNHGRVADCYSTGLVCGGYRAGDYIPEAEGEEKGRKAGRGGFRDFIQTIAETIAETVAETAAYVIGETKAGIETLYEIVTTTLSAEGGPGVQETEEQDAGIPETEEQGPGVEESKEVEAMPPELEGTDPSETEMTESGQKETEIDQNLGTEATEASQIPGSEATEASRVPETGETEASRVPGTGETEANRAPGTGETEANRAPGTGETETSQAPGTGQLPGKNTGQANGESSDRAEQSEKSADDLNGEKTEGKESSTGDTTEKDQTTSRIEDPKETDEAEEPEETEEETGADETDGELINDLPGSEDMGLTEEEQAALKVLGGLVGRNLGGTIENSFQAGRRAVKSTEWTTGGITGFNPGGQIDSCYYVWPSTLEKPEQEYEGVAAVSTELLTGENATERLNLDGGIWISRETEENQPEAQEPHGEEQMRYRHYYPQQSAFVDRGQPYQYTLGYFEIDGLRVDALTKRAYVSTEEAFSWLFEGTDYLDYEIRLEADLNLASFGKSIGTVEQPFTGILDGDGHVISGLRQPLFHVLGDGSAVYYLLLDQADVRQMGVRGEDEYGPESNVSGVLAGYSRNAVIDSCGAVGMIHLSAGGSSRPVFIGGLIGEAGAGTSIYESYAFVNIAEDLGGESPVTAGGLVGLMDQEAGAENCYATGRLECSGTAGGFAGENRGEIRDSFVTTIVGTMADRAGAFVGYMPEAGELPERTAETQETELVPLQRIGEESDESSVGEPATGDSGEDQWEKERCTIIGSAYDAQMSGFEDGYAQGMLTGEMSGEDAAMPGGDWYTTDGAYPQLKCMALHTHETYILRSKASAIPLILPNGIYITDIPEGDQIGETEGKIRITGSVEMGVPTQIDGDAIEWSEAERIKLQGDGTAVLEMD